MGPRFRARSTGSNWDFTCETTGGRQLAPRPARANGARLPEIASRRRRAALKIMVRTARSARHDMSKAISTFRPDDLVGIGPCNAGAMGRPAGDGSRKNRCGWELLEDEGIQCLGLLASPKLGRNRQNLLHGRRTRPNLTASLRCAFTACWKLRPCYRLLTMAKSHRAGDRQKTPGKKRSPVGLAQDVPGWNTQGMFESHRPSKHWAGTASNG